MRDLSAYIEAGCENAELDFKAGFDPRSNQEWCEILKDIVAIANSGGGCIIVGKNDEGEDTGYDVGPVLSLDPAEITDKVCKYTGCVYADFEIRSYEFKGNTLACISLGPCRIPMVFTKPGTYAVPGGNTQKSAFNQGAVYFRHGAKSEPGTSEDIRLCLEREIDRIRGEWLGNIRKVVEAPRGSQVIVVSENQGELKVPVGAMRLTTDQNALLVRELDHNITHPYRQKEIIPIINERLKGAVCVTGHDLVAIRRVHHIETRPELYYKPLYGSPNYSEAFVEWMASEFERDSEFFDKVRKQHRVQTEVSQQDWIDDHRVRWLSSYMRQSGLGLSSAARKLNISVSTVSRILQGTYIGNRVKMLEKIQCLMDREAGQKG